MLKPLLCTIAALLLLVGGCSQDTTEEKSSPDQNAQASAPEPALFTCRGCHSHELDTKHNFSCTTCHQGRDNIDSAEKAHEGLIAKPAHPDHMMTTCGSCHEKQVASSHNSLHFTSSNEVNTVRRAFGADHDLARADEIPIHESPATPLDLADDLLRRRCLRCHIRYDGDNYAETLRGVGCAACHLEFSGGEMTSHAFVGRTPDQQCLHCHNGNFVGFDYYGRYEHDFHWDYRTPYKKDGSDADRPYGVEYHQLSTDIHQQAGMACVDCHPGSGLMSAQSQTISCTTCHSYRTKTANASLSKKDGKVIFTSQDRSYTVPQMADPAHGKYGKTATCTACHALWTYSDVGTHLFRQDAEEYDDWEALSVQGSFEVERELFVNLNTDEGYPYPFMSDKLTGQGYYGLWHKGYELRRWEFTLICKDKTGRFTTCRPLLDLHLTWMDSEEEVIFDNATPGNAPPYGLLPYTPHTIGKAGPFYKERLKTNHHLLDQPLNLDKGKGLNPAMEAKP